MTMELRDGRYLKSVFYTELRVLGPNAGNLIGWIYKDKGEPFWNFVYRFRYYEDEHDGIRHKSEDRKSWFHVTGAPGAEPGELAESIKMIFETAGEGSYEEVLVESASAVEQMKRISEQPWANMKGPMTEEEYDAFKNR